MRRSADVYVESSALVAWILDEARAKDVAMHLRAAEAPWLSALTVAECSRALLRAGAMPKVDIALLRGARRRLAALAPACRVIPVDQEILERAGRPFPVEPVRTLDAIHLASVERALVAAPALTVLSLDERVRQNAERLGATIVP